VRYSRTESPRHYPDNDLVAMNAGSITNTGGSQAHLNMQPYLVLNFSIALQGIFPSQT
jgi:microcystin-dependent protein